MADTIEKIYTQPDNNSAELMAMMNSANNNWNNNPLTTF